ncbi:hypothetical protein DIJ69_11865 [Streptomyces globisporus]|nr:hypothetical protein DIJ69_11865 [Streptomyces globisporus]
MGHVRQASSPATRGVPPRGARRQGVSCRSGRIRERGLVPCIVRRRRESTRSVGDRRQRREVRCQTPRARPDRQDTP